MPIVLDGTNGINTPDLESAGPISGTTGTFSGDVQVDGIATNLYPLVSGTAVASTSGTSIDFTGIPAYVKRITVTFSGVSTNGASVYLFQLGDSGGIETTGYQATGSNFVGATTSTSGFPSHNNAAVVTHEGSIVFSNLSGNTWSGFGNLASVGAGQVVSIAGSKTLSDTLTQVRITTVNGTDTFDAGSINILYE